MRRNWLTLGSAVALSILALGVFGWTRVRAERTLQAELEEADRELSGGLGATAYRRLTRLDAAWPDRPEIAWRLGHCEKARGRLDAALDAWERVPFESPEGPLAAVDRGELLVNIGRHAPAEAILLDAARAPEPVALKARRALARLYRFQGRLTEVRRLIEADWGRSTDPAALLKEHWELDHAGFPIEGVRRVLGAADQDDDRVWLGLANLATRTARFDEAAGWLGRCEARRPEDQAVWRGWLDYALAVRDPDRARQSLTHLPATEFTLPEVLELRAWFASRRNDTDAERAALEALALSSPRRGEALGRLVELASAAGRSDEVARLHQQKSDHDRALEGYRRRIGDPNASDHAAELAAQAETLGRRFEARGWATLAARRGSLTDRERLARLDRTEPSPFPDDQTLASVLSDVAVALPASGPNPDSGQGPGKEVDFVDDAETAGLRFTFDNGQSTRRELPETMSGGVALLDYDGDGRLDVYAVQGGSFPPNLSQPVAGDRLFRNRGDGTFEDTTARSGIEGFPRGYGHGVTVGDFDNDGRPDLFVTRWRSYALYRNRGEGTFEDVTEAAGLGGDRDWPTSAAWADLDGDGDLDLYVCHYLEWDAENPRACPDPKAGVNKYCDPREFRALPDHVFRNDGGRFVDVSAEAGIVDVDGRGLGVVAADLDDDGRVDLFVANDTTANYLFRNLGGFRFEEVGHESGVAAGDTGGYQAGMGIAAGDLDGDGQLDLAVTNFYNESTTYYHNLGGGLFSDRKTAVGLAAPSRHLLGFGAAFLDTNNDGRLDLMTVNGHVNDSRPYFPYAMPARLYLGGPNGRLVESRAGGPWDVLRVGRGLAVGDLDNDGRIDAIVVAQNEPLAYFHNRTAGGASLTLKLEGSVSNRDGVGARVTVTSQGRRQVAQQFGGGSYQSSGDSRLHFGLGDAATVDEVEVRWPSGRVDRHARLSAGSGYLLREGSPTAAPLEGFVGPGPQRGSGGGPGPQPGG